MITQIITIRAKQLYRFVARIGVFHVIFASILALLFCVFVANQLEKPMKGAAIIMIAVGMVYFIHITRRDKTFLSIIYDKPHFIYLAEYLLLSSPILVLSFIAKRYDLMLYQMIGVSIIPFVNISAKEKRADFNNRLLKLIPNDCFEIKSGLRTYFYFYFPFNVVALFFGFWIGTSPIVIILNTLVFVGFYQTCEPRNVIEANELGPEKFILKKLKMNLLVFASLHLPIIIVFLLFNYQSYIILVIIFAASLMLLTVSILLKYASYSPNASLTANGIIIAITCMVFPIIIFMLPAYYFKAKNNLTYYLYDYN